ncbi:hypothetical protein SAMN00120144_3436 [Hymenobacter roseosalivarius DSM 11622]|uniref:DUF481 domain-containing protein n=1 Tax=Hymenobacter roseosalivarius DSM 11622 TaxID=645990 RepID=A0A1W1W049_9BACT|nr:DUF481 domain-containing protein [Hymenobacter roseosalivarius]SMB98494.1 hypothetical protein SAMN00120144_3436 [Hymenobacter roseosalivarius DSM 11622]
MYLALLLARAAQAQDLPPDTTLIVYTGQLTGAYSAGGVNRTLLSTAHTATFTRGEHVGLPLSGSFIYGKQDRLLNERELLLNATPYYRLNRFRFYGIGGFERSNLRGIDHRVQLGAGPGWAFYSDSLGREISVSNLLIRESTNFQDGSQRVTARNSARLKIAYSHSTITLSALTYYQPSLSDFGDYRFSNLTTLALKLTRHLALNFTYNYTHETRVIEGRFNDNTNVTLGVSYATNK